MWRFEQRTSWIGSLRVKLILLTHTMLKWVWPHWTNIECSLFKPPHNLQHMHIKLTKHGRFCKQNNQIPTKSHDELEDIYILELLLIACSKTFWKLSSRLSQKLLVLIPFSFVILLYTNVPLIHPTSKLDPYKLDVDSSQMTLSTFLRGLWNYFWCQII